MLRVSIGAACAALMLSGCAAMTMKGLRERGPYFERTSPKPVADLVECITKGWDARGAQYTYLPTKTGAQLSVQTTLPVYAIDIVDNGSERRVTYYRMKSIYGDGETGSDREVAACL